MWSLLRRLRWLLLLPIPIVWCLIGHDGGLEFAESKLVDLRFAYRGPMQYPAKFVYVDIDSKSIGKLGNFPWDRKDFADTARALMEVCHVKTIGMDIVFSEEGNPEVIDQDRMHRGETALGSYLWKHDKVVVGAFFGTATFQDRTDHMALKQRSLPLLAGPLPPVQDIEPPERPMFYVPGRPPITTPGVGVIDTIDGGTRWVPLYEPTSQGIYYNMGLQLARIYMGVERSGITATDTELTLTRPDKTVVQRIPLTNKQLLEINWFSGWNGFASPLHASFCDVYQLAKVLYDPSSADADKAEARKQLEELHFDDAIVLIGPTDLLLHDLANTPMDDRAVPRVSVHANTAATILAGAFLARLSARSIYLITFLLTAIVTVLAIAGGARSILAKVIALLALVSYVAVCFYLFAFSRMILPMTVPLGSALSTSFAALIWQVVEEQRQKGRIKGMFSTYLAPTLVNRMIESGRNPELGGHDAELTAYFSDIQNFSTFSEVLTSQQLGELLNEYLTACTDILLEEGGSLDKYIGDAIVVMFGGLVDIPDHAYRACVATQLVQARIGALREKWVSEGDKWPKLVHQLRTRIGLNTGVCMVGNMGSRSRFNYTMMGDDVNLAARMESGAKSWGVYTMVAESTMASCRKVGDRVVFRPLGRIVVKGRTQAVPIHEIVGLKESLPPNALDCIAVFSQALDRFYVKDWDGAEALFRKCLPLEAHQPGRDAGIKTNPSMVYLEIIEEYRANPPPADWDGSYVMTEK